MNFATVARWLWIFVRYTFHATFALLVIFLVGRALWEMPKVWFEPLFPEENFDTPVFLTQFAEDPDRLVTVEKEGIIKWFNRDSKKAEGTIVDLRHKVSARGNWEDGLLSIAFDPHFSINRYFYVYYTSTRPLRNVLSRFKMGENNMAEAESEKVLIEIAQPNRGHNGGTLLFGEDGYLYVSVGEGGLGFKEKSILQTKKTFLGSILRIDPSRRENGSPYAIPADNPFLNSERPEIWAYGLRNPWRMSFDRGTGQLIAGDVQRMGDEEINVLKRGGNYGWPLMEGQECFEMGPKNCNKKGLLLPTLSLRRSITPAVIGGFVYRGKEISTLVGRYVFASYERGKLFSVDLMAPSPIKTLKKLSKKLPTLYGKKRRSNMQFTSLAELPDGELCALDHHGAIYQIKALNPWRFFVTFLYMMLSFR